jgi:small-conductance mechanosensitive channel
VAAAISSRTPEPTTTPDFVAQQVEEFVAETGLSGATVVGLPAEDWIDLAFSLLIILVGYGLAVLGVKALLALLRQVIHRPPSGFNEAFLESIGSELRWLILVFVIRYALLRLDFLGDGLRTFINDLCFTVGSAIVLAMILKLIRAAGQWYRKDIEPEKDKERLEPFLLVLQRLAYALAIIVWISIVLSHFGINVTALSAVLVVIALVISLGAKDVISDAINGFVILLDQPFRVGDAVGIEELDKWGDVVDIGTRRTRIRTRDNEYVIVPNSMIGASQIFNYTFPNPRYRVHSTIPVAYGSDFDQVQRVVEEAVRGVEGVLPDHPIEALFLEYRHSARLVRVQWWVDDMLQEWYIMDRVNKALEIAFGQAGIEMPVTTRDLIVKVDTESEEVSRSYRESGLPGMPHETGNSVDRGERD